MSDTSMSDDQITVTFECVCGKKYKFQSGLSKHKKNCGKTKESVQSREELLKLVEHYKGLADHYKEMLDKAKQPQQVQNIVYDSSHNVVNIETFNQHAFLP